MKKILLPAALALTFGAGLAAAPLAAHAANARHPHRNVNHRNDAGNSTGDSAVEQLNAQSLQAARSGTTPAVGGSTTGSSSMSGGAMSGGSMSGGSTSSGAMSR
jgi:hypothetical protein